MSNESSWLSLEDAKEWANKENWIVSEVGFLIEETKEFILIANKKSTYDKENPEIGGVMKIPTTWIRKRIDLTKHIQ